MEGILDVSSSIDWAALRSSFPVTSRYSYLNTAASGPVSQAAADASIQFYRDLLESGDRRWEQWIGKRERARADIAKLINAEPDEIAFTINTSSGMNVIVDAFEGRGEVISCDLEFPVSTITWMHRGVKVNVIKTKDGRLEANDVGRAMTSNTALICLSHVQYSNGLRLDLDELGASKGNHALVVNASQSAGVLPIDVKRMKIDALCSTGHKWMLGGYGSGFIYISREVLNNTRPRQIGWMSVENPFEMENQNSVPRADAGARAELGCPHFAGILSLGASAASALEIGAENIEMRALALNRYLTERLQKENWKVLSPLDDENLRSAETLVEASHPRRVVAHLASRNVAVTLKPQGFRVSTHFFNNTDDIERLMDALREVPLDS